jgi:hypothetical protein
LPGVVNWPAASIRWFYSSHLVIFQVRSGLFHSRVFAPLSSIPPVLLPNGSLPGHYAAAAAAAAAARTLLVHCSSHFNLLVRGTPSHLQRTRLRSFISPEFRFYPI